VRPDGITKGKWRILDGKVERGLSIFGVLKVVAPACVD
jgi:hypothetical protein